MTSREMELLGFIRRAAESLDAGKVSMASAVLARAIEKYPTERKDR